MNIASSTLKLFLWLLFLTGLIYPMVITLIGQTTMKTEASGDFLKVNEKIIGSKLIAQKFTSDKYFWPRPSASDYNPQASGGSNLGPTSSILKKDVEQRRKTYTSENIPSELLYASGSSLDPHISLDAAYFQAPRIAAARKLDEEGIKNLIESTSENNFHYLFGSPYVNVLVLNLALDKMELERR